MPESELPNKELFDVTPDAVFVIEIEEPNQGQILEANHAAAIMHGYTREELLTMRIGDLDTPEEASHVSEWEKRVHIEDWPRVKASVHTHWQVRASTMQVSTASTAKMEA